MNSESDVVIAHDAVLPDVEDTVASVCFELNKLSNDYTADELNPLLCGIHSLVNQIDTMRVEQEKRESELDESHHEISTLALKLEQEKALRKEELDQSLDIQDSAAEESNTLRNCISELQNKLSDSVNSYKNLLSSHNSLLSDLYIEKESKELLGVKNKTLENSLKEAKQINYTLMDDLVKSKNSWSKSKWLDDITMDSYFESLSQNTTDQSIVFLGPSVTQKLLFSKDSAKDISNSDYFLKSKFVFMCVSDSKDQTKEDKGSHWSLLFYDKSSESMYHFDSLIGVNLSSAKKIALNLNVTSDKVFEECCFQQKNSFECGINTLVNAKHIFNYYCQDSLHIPFRMWLEAPKCADYSRIRTPASSRDSKKGGSAPLKPVTLRKVEGDKWQIVPGKSGKVHSPKHFSAMPSIPCSNRYQLLREVKCSTNLCLNEPVQLETCKKNSVQHKVKTKKRNQFIVTPKLTHVSSKTDSAKGQSPCNVQKSDGGTVNSGLGKGKIVLLSDSHGRFLPSKLLEHCSSSFEVTGMVKPGGHFKHVIEGFERSSGKLTKKDTLMVLAGTNDIYKRCDSEQLMNSVKALIEGTVNTNLLLFGIPFRKDKQYLNGIISQVNEEISKMSTAFQHVQFVSLASLFGPRYYTKHGLHFNNFGKKLIVDLMYNAIVAPSHPPPTKLTPLTESKPVNISVRITCRSNPAPSRKLPTSVTSQASMSTPIVSRVFTNKRFLGRVQTPGRGP